MCKVLKIGIVGCGAIGSSLAKKIVKDFAGQAKLVALYDIEPSKAGLLSINAIKSRRLAKSTLKELINASDLVVEAASAKSSWEIARQVISGGKDMLIMSVGGIAAHYKGLARLAGRKKARVFLPSGAISGVDALKAAKQGGIKEVTLTTRKNPNSFAGNIYLAQKGISLKNIREDLVLFAGSAQEAVKFFPQNINVAALLGLAGLGMKKTRVEIIASPSVRNNIHEIRIASAAGEIFSRTENVLHPDNPKTSYLAVLSAVASLRQVLDPVRVGT